MRIKSNRVFILLLLFSSCNQIVKSDLKSNSNENNKLLEPTYQKEKIIIQESNENYVLLQGEAEGVSVLKIGSAIFSDTAYNSELEEKSKDAYVVDFELIDQGLMKYLKSKKVEIGYFIPDNSLIIKTKANIQEIRKWKKVKNVTPYFSYLKVSKSDGDLKSSDKVLIKLWQDSSVDEVVAFCKKENISIYSQSGKSLIASGSNIIALIKESSVLKAEKYYPSEVFSISSSQIKDVIFHFSLNSILNFGSRAKISIMDMGLDSLHADLKGSIKEIYDIAGDHDTGELSSHGTHIAGIIAGKSVVSAGKIKGINPEAEILFYALGDNLKGLMVPPDLEPLLLNSFNKQSYIVNLSWGTYSSTLPGKYLSISKDIDEFVYAHPEMIIVTAVGNDGKSIASPATAKNVLSIGSLNGKNIAEYSGRNGTIDGRIKPDLLVQGSSITSLELNNGYVDKSGTSQSAAVISGIVSQLIPEINYSFKISPSYSVIKSLLLANTSVLGLESENGYGSLILNRPILPLYFILQPYKNIKQIVEKEFSVENGDIISIVLSWTDPPASENSFYQLVNDYDLDIVFPNGQIQRLQDHTNPIEKHTFTTPVAGKYKVRIIPIKTPFIVNDISLVIKSQNGFSDADSTPENLTVNNQETVDLNLSDSTQISTEENNINTGVTTPDNGNDYNISDSNLTQNNGMPVTPFQNPVFDPELFNAYNNDEILETSLSENNSNSNNTPKVYFKPGTGNLYIQAMGSESNKIANISLIADSKLIKKTEIPIYNQLENKYQTLSINMPDTTNILNGNVTVITEYNTETNIMALSFVPDNKSPHIGISFPVQNGFITNEFPWIILEDSDSGLDTNIIVGVNGIFYTNGEIEYNPGNNKLTVKADRIFEPNFIQEVTVNILQFKDIVGNMGVPYIWHFYYINSNDVIPPDTPQSLIGYATNQRISLSWIPNKEKDLIGYNIYTLDQYGLNPEKINQDLIRTNNYYFYTNHLDNIGVTAVDYCTNESDLAIVRLDYEYRPDLPEIIISNVPAKTNQAVDVKFQIRHVVPLLFTNVTVDYITAHVSWKNGWGTVTIPQEGVHLFSIVVKSADSNIITNTVTFEIDKSAPDMPGNIIVMTNDRNLEVQWAPVKKDGVFCTYNIFTNDILVLSNSTSTNVFLNFKDYGLNTVSIVAVDSLGNKSAKKNVNINTETGVHLNLDNLYISKLLTGNCALNISTNSYNEIYFEIKNKNRNKTWKFPRAFSLSFQEALSDWPDGDTLLIIKLMKNGSEINQGRWRYITNIIVDQTVPEVFWLNNNSTNAANMLFTKEPKVTGYVIESNLTSFSVYKNNQLIDTITSNQITINLQNNDVYSLIAKDKAGNIRTLNSTIIKDKNMPHIFITGMKNLISGQISDEYLEGFEIYTNRGLYFSSSYAVNGDICIQPLDQGEILINAWDRAGNTNQFISNILRNGNNENRSFTIFVNGMTNTYFNTSDISVKLNGATNSDDIFVHKMKNGDKYTISSGVIFQPSYQFFGIDDAEYSLIINCNGKEYVKEVIVDTQQPDIQILPLVNMPAKIGDIVKIKDMNLDNFSIVVDGLLKGLDALLGQGEYNISVIAQDKAGNRNLKNTTVRVTDSYSNYNVAVFKSLQNNKFYNHPITIEMLDPNLNWYIEVNGKSQSPYVSSEGIYTIKVTGSKGETNTIIYTNQIIVTLDFTKPSIFTSMKREQFYSKVPDVFVDDKNWLSNYVLMDNTKWDGQFLTEGLHHYYIKAFDKAGNTSEFYSDFYLDSLSPLVAISPTNIYVQEVTPVVSIVEENPFNIDYYQNGEFSLAYGLLDIEGDYDLTVSVMDKAGNQSSANHTFIIDLTPPQIDPGIINGFTYPTNTVISPKIVDLHPGSLEMTLDGYLYKSTKITNTGFHTLDLWAEDKAGNTTISNLVFYISDEMPSIMISGMDRCLYMDGIYYSSNTQNINISISNANSSTMEVSINGKHTNNNFILNYDGTFNLSIQAQAVLNGNSFDLQQNKSFVIDKTPPIITIPVLTNNTFNTQNLHILVSVNDHILNKKVLLNGKPVSTDFVISTDGDYHLLALAQDILGRQISNNYSFAVDTHKSLVKLYGIENGKYYTHPIDYQVIINSSLIEHVKVSVNEYSMPLQGTINNYGSNTIIVEFTDKAGRAFSQKYDIFVDNILPSIVISGVGDSQVSKFIDGSIQLFDEFIQAYEVTIEGNRGFYWKKAGTQNTNLGFYLSTDDTYSLTAKISDISGNMTYTNIHFAVDHLVPQILIEGITNNGYYPETVTINVKDIDIHRNGKLIWLDNILLPFTNNMISLTFEVPLEGDHLLKVLAGDSAGNANQSIYNFTIDRTFPVITLFGAEESKAYSNARPIEISVNEINLSDVFIMDTVTGNGPTRQFSRQLHFTASETGKHQITVTARDKAGNETISNFTFIVDQIKPTVYFSGIHDGEYFNHDNLTAGVLSYDNYPWETKVWVDNVEQTDPSLFFIQGEGPHQIIAMSRDLVTNTSYITNHITIDLTPPQIFITGVTNGEYYNSDRTIQIRIMDDNINLTGLVAKHDNIDIPLTLDVNGDMVGTFNVLDELTFHYLEVSEVDRAGNMNSKTVTYSLDKTKPFVSITRSTQGYLTADESVAFAGWDNPGGSGLKQVVSYYSKNSGMTNSVFPLSFDQEGEYSVSAFSVDNAGNKSDISNVIFYVDKTPPQISVYNSPSHNNFSTIEATYNDVINFHADITDAKELQSYHVMIDSMTVTNVSNIGNTTCSIDFQVMIQDWQFVPHVLEIYAYDKVGNSSHFQQTYQFVDHVQPTHTITFQNTDSYFKKLPANFGSNYYGDGRDFLVTINASDKFGIKSISINGFPGNYINWINNNTFRLVINGGALGTETHYFPTITIIDSNDNLTNLNYQFVVDKKAPYMTNWSGNMAVNGSWDDSSPPSYSVLNYTIHDNFGLKQGTLEYHILAYWGFYNEMTKDELHSINIGGTTGDFSSQISWDMWAYSWGLMGDVCSHHAIYYITIDISDIFGNRLYVPHKRFDGHRLYASPWTWDNWKTEDFPQPCLHHDYWWRSNF